MTAQTPSRMEQRLQAQFPEHLIALPGGAHVAWREAGDTASDFAVVMLHGISSGAASWLDVALELAPRTRVLAWDAPGYGRSTPLAPAAPTGADYARVLDQSLQALGVRRCRWWGTRWVLSWARPGRCRPVRAACSNWC
jgi:pimeloyl-ACP methyl ester carboxylesterase